MKKIKFWYKLPENVEFFVGNDGLHYFRILADNGEPISVSEGYTRKYNAIKGARVIAKIMNGTTEEDSEE